MENEDYAWYEVSGSWLLHLFKTPAKENLALCGSPRLPVDEVGYGVTPKAILSFGKQKRNGKLCKKCLAEMIKIMKESDALATSKV